MIKFTNINDCRQWAASDFCHFVEYTASLYSYTVPPFHYRIANWLQSGNGRLNDPGPVPIQGRLSVAQIGTGGSTYGPTPTHREALEIAEKQYAELKRELDGILQKELPALEEALQKAGAPWSPGREIPGVD